MRGQEREKKGETGKKGRNRKKEEKGNEGIGKQRNGRKEQRKE